MNNRINPALFSGVFDSAERIFLKTIHPRSKLWSIRERCWINKKGITIIELVVVMIIIAIGAALMAPNIGAWLPHYRLRSVTRDIVSTMRVAQMKAVSNNIEYRVKFNQGAGSYILQYRTTAGGNWIDEGVTQTLLKGIQIFDLNPDGFNAEFNPNSTSSAGSITLKNTKGAQRKITLTSATGRIRIE